MKDHVSYTTEEIARILKVSKLTVYDLIKKGELPAYRVGRQMRVDERDLEAYIEASKNARKGEPNRTPATPVASGEQPQTSLSGRPIIISGQDLSLDILANYMEKNMTGFRPLRSHLGSLNSLMAMYRGEADVVSVHLYDGDTGEYNLPYIKRVLVNESFAVIRLLSRWVGFYVKRGNPQNIQTWRDLTKPGVRVANREKGSGARVLLDEKLRVEQISRERLKGYDAEETNHIGVAAKVASGEADVGIGIEKTARLVGVDFIPLMKEQYDLVVLKTAENEGLLSQLLEVIALDAFQQEIESLGGYDLSETGRILYET